MRITTAAWNEYIRKMSAISEEAANKMQKWIQQNGFGNDQALLDYAFALSSHYGEAIGALACDMYEKIADAQGVTIEPAEIADTPEYGEVAKAVHGTMNESLNKVGPTVGRLVKQTGADTMLKNAKRDGIWYAWVAFGDTCPYCLMISAIGWRRAGKNTLRGKHADHIHPHCDCQYVVDFKGDLQVEGYSPEKMRKDIMDIVDPDGLEYSDFDDFLNYHGRYSVGLQKRDKKGLRILRRSLAEKKESEKLAAVGEQAKLIAKYGNEMNMVLMGSVEDVQRWQELKTKHGYNEKDVNDYLAKDTKSWDGVLKGYSDKFRERLGDATLKDMEPFELDALQKWTGELYSDINRYERYGINTGEYVISIAKTMEKALDKAVIPEQIIAKRGVEKSALKYMFPDLDTKVLENVENLKGREFTDNGFFATTPHPEGGLGGGVKMYVKIPEGTKGAYIESIAYNENEHELLLQKGYTYRIVNAGYEQNKYFKDEYDPVLWVEVLHGK